ncbi:MAG: hypothetical protein VZR09_04950 [Candidatus Gastranaerophilaceae bacterium]|nr:hypothetical protein [Candidatus Gastranaerophilaceae bacterium]
MGDIIWGSIVSAIFLLLFVIAEIAYKKGTDVEFTRKFVHFGGAFVTIFFPFIIHSHWTVLTLASVFAVIMILTKKLGLLQSVHGVTRKSEGALYHPIAIYSCFLYAEILQQPWFYVIAVLILAISDASAALVGKSYGAYEYVVEIGTRKTFEGSITFFLTSFLITHLILLLATNTGRIESVLIALLISTIVTIFEGVSLKGADNLFIPLAAMFILSKNITPTVYGITRQIIILSLFIIWYLIVMKPYKRVGFSGVLLLGLINYVIWALLGNILAVVMFLFSFICQKTNLILNYECDVADAYRVRPIFYILAVPITCAFLGQALGNIVCIPFITSLICEGYIIKTKFFDGNLNKGLTATSIISVIVTIIALGVKYVFIG